MVDNTLHKRFPYVKKLVFEVNHPLELLIKPYLSWNLLTMDDNINILITPNTGGLHSVQNELLIMEGEAAKLWLNLKGIMR